MKQTILIIQLLWVYLGFCSIIGTGKRISHLKRRLHINESKLAGLDGKDRVVVRKESLDPEAFLFYLKKDILLEYTRLCSRVSLTGQKKLNPEELNETVSILGEQYSTIWMFTRGKDQVSGYLWGRQQDDTVHLVASFAGTSSWTDVAHIVNLGETNIHDVTAHSGLSYLVSKNLYELDSFVQRFRRMDKNVDLIIAGHSLGGMISFLAIYDLKSRWSQDPKVRIRSLNLAGPSPFRNFYAQKVEDLVGYNNLLSVCRRADYIYRLSETFELVGTGPMLYLVDNLVIGEPMDSRLDLIKKHFGRNHYVTEFAKDIEDEVVLWPYIDQLGQVTRLRKRLLMHEFLKKFDE